MKAPSQSVEGRRFDFACSTIRSRLAFDELYMAERTCMDQTLAMNTGQRLRSLPDTSRRRRHGAWGDKVDARLHLDAWRRVLDREEPDYAT